MNQKRKSMYVIPGGMEGVSDEFTHVHCNSRLDVNSEPCAGRLAENIGKNDAGYSIFECPRCKTRGVRVGRTEITIET